MNKGAKPGEKRPRPPEYAAPKQPKPPQQENAAFVPDGDIEMKKDAASSNSKSEKRPSVESTESYNPFEHREVAKPNTDFGSLAHMLKTSLGSGILAMPMAFRNSGLIFGFVGTILIGIICTHCIQLLVRSSQVLCKRLRVPTLSYSKTAEAAFETGPQCARRMAKGAKVIITAELLLSFILGNTVYVIFMAETILQTSPGYSRMLTLYEALLAHVAGTVYVSSAPELYLKSYRIIQLNLDFDIWKLWPSFLCHVADFYAHPGIDVRLYVLMLWIPLCIMCFFKNLKSLVPFSIIANIFVVVSFGITLYYIFRDIHAPQSVYYVAPFERWPQFLTTVIFAIEGIGTVLPIENEMRHPEHFIGGRCGIAYISMTIVIALYTVTGFFGYLEYGEDTRGSITLNLPIGDVLAQVVKILIATAIFFTYALQFYVPINIILDIIKPRVPEKQHKYYSFAVRVGLVTLTIIMSIAVPKLEPIISLVGAICFSMLGLLLPSLIDTLTRHPDFGRCKWRLVKNIIIIFISLVALVSGSYVSIMSIIETYGLK